MPKVTIANGQTKSGGIDLGGPSLVGLIIPVAFTGTTITFEVGILNVGGTYVPLKKEDGTSYSITVAPSTYVSIDPSVFIGVRYLKIVSGAAEGGARVVDLIVQPIV